MRQDETHPESIDRVYSPFVGQARVWVEKYGPFAYADFVKAVLKGRSYDDNMTYVGATIFQITLEDAIKRLPDPYDYDAVRNAHDVQELLRFAAGAYGVIRPDVVEQLSVQLAMWWHGTVYRLAGRRTFEVTPNLAERLLKTELHGLTGADAHLPFPSQYVIVPKSAGLKVWNEDTGYHDVTGFYVAAATLGGNPIWHVLAVGEGKAAKGLIEDDAIFFFTLPFEADKPIDWGMQHAIERAGSRRVRIARGAETVAKIQDEIRQFFTFILNLVMYARWPENDQRRYAANLDWVKAHEAMTRHPKGSNKYERARAIYRSLDPKERILLGSSVKASLASERKLLVRTLVMGHWHHYWIGKGRTERVLRWVTPHWRGPEDGPESNPKRVVDADPK